jgi:hypothetical protein
MEIPKFAKFRIPIRKSAREFATFAFPIIKSGIFGPLWNLKPAKEFRNLGRGLNSANLSLEVEGIKTAIEFPIRIIQLSVFKQTTIKN